MASRLRRALARIGTAFGLGAVFTGALVGGAVLHLDLPAARRSVERVVRGVLDGVFEGTVDAQGVERLGLDGVEVDLVVVRDPSGVEVLRARHVRAEASVPSIVRSLLGGGDLVLGIPFARVEQVDVRVEPNAQGHISIAAAFNPRAQAPGPPGRPVRLSLDHVEIGSGYVHGKPDGEHPLDADVRHLTGAVRVEPGMVAVDVRPTGVVERGLLPGEIAGTAEYHLRVLGPSTPEDTTTPAVTRMWGHFAGRVGHVEITARGLMEGAHVELTAHAPRARPAQVKALLPSYPIEDTVAADVEVKGDLPRLTFDVDASTESHGSADAEGWVQLGAPLRGEVTFHTRALDPAMAGPGVPHVPVTSQGKVRAEIGAITSVRVETHTEPTALDGQPIPAVDATAVFDGFTWTGSASVHEPGAPAQGTFAVQKDGSVKFDATVTAPALSKVPRLAGKLAGAARVRATGVVKEGEIDATVNGEVRDFAAKGGVRVARGDVRGRVTGPFAGLSVDATVSATDAVLGGYAVQEAVVGLRGPVLTPRVTAHLVDENDTRIDASGVVDAKAAAASGVKVRMEHDGAVASGTVARVGAGAGGVRIEGVELAGPDLGKVEGSLRVVGGELAGTLHAEALDLTALRKLAGLPYTVGGKVDADIALRPVRGGRRGHVRVALRDGSMALLTGVSADVSATFDGDRVEGGGEVAIRGAGSRCDRTIARLRLTNVDSRIHGPLLAGKTWEDATGTVGVDADDWDLECLAAFVPVGLPFSEIHGQLAAKLTLDRPEGQRLPSIRGLDARSYYLTVVGPEGPGEPWASRDLDFTLRGDLDGATGETSLSLEVFDEALVGHGALVTRLDTDALLDPARRAASLAATDLAATFFVPRRRLDRLRTLPTFVRDRLPPLTGEAALAAYAVGSLSHPRAVVRVDGWNVAPGPDGRGLVSQWLAPVSLGAFAYYDGARAAAEAQVSRGHREVLTAEASVTAPIDALRAGAPVATYLTGRGSAAFDAFPLGDVPALGDRAVGGHLSGRVALEGLGEDPSLAVDLRADDLTIGPDLAFREARVAVRTLRAGMTGARRPEPGRAPVSTAIASVRLLDRAGGALDASGYLQLGWQDGLVPRPRQDRPADLHARLARFRLASIEPFTGGVVREIGGFVDGAVRVGWGRLEETEKGTVEADLRVTDGSFYLPSLGQGFRLVGAGPGAVRVVADRGGTVRVENLAAEGDAGRVRVQAAARLEGLTFRSATGQVAIAEGEALPVTLEGVELGTAWGTIDLAAEVRERRLALDVRSKDLHFELPSAPRRDVQELAPNPDVTISHQPPPAEEPGRRAGRPLAVTLHLNRAVIEGSGIYLELSTVRSSPPVFLVDGETRASGDVRVVSGTVEQVNRKFVIDQASVHFEGEVGNPYVSATAHWDAPDGSRVFVDYVGRVKPLSHDNLHLRSNPPRTQQEILAMLMFGSETGGEILASPSPGAQGASASQVPGSSVAVNVGGELAAQQLNALLTSFVPLKGLSTRLGASEAGGIQGSLVYKVGDTVTALATYEGGVPAGGAGQGAGQSGSLTLDWRFYRNWLIRAKVGARDDPTSSDRFSGTVELLWQYRY